MLTVGILAKRVKIGKNLSIRAFGCRNILLYSQIKGFRSGMKVRIDEIASSFMIVQVS